MEDVVRLVVDGVSQTYPDGTQALTDVSLEVRKGEFAGILGYNGSGKTTLLKVMDGLIRDFRGNVFLDGREIRDITAREIYRKMGIVFQNPNDQLFASTVFEDVAFGPINMGFREEEVVRRVDRALRDVDMEGFARKAIHHLSFGEKKRVCIAGLLSMGHEILLLDEPTAGLDPLGEYHLMNLLRRLNKEKGVTVVMATHSVDMVPLFLDTLYILNGGRVVSSGAPTEVFRTPEGMGEAGLRLPLVSELIYRLKHEDGMPFEKVPLTIGEARREIIRAFEKGHFFSEEADARPPREAKG
ncbi:MAG TPA: ATP-binding cassette domain-containing protein [Syntrophales bacterium]|nr:ATP-binding cassette domain-containing protein [Syntrophales bacterium]